jgi:hypothetical protein
MISVLLLSCALAQPPWSFIDPLSIEAKLKTIHELIQLYDKYPEYEWGIRPKDDPPKEDEWKPSPWVYGRWRTWYRERKSA